jgi:hypothetical protein
VVFYFVFNAIPFGDPFVIVILFYLVQWFILQRHVKFAFAWPLVNVLPLYAFYGFIISASFMGAGILVGENSVIPILIYGVVFSSLTSFGALSFRSKSLL